MRLFLTFLLCLAVSNTLASELPRYKFDPGQVLRYESDSSMKYEGGSHQFSTRLDVYVVRKNDDGSFKLLAVQKSSFSQGDSAADERSEVATADMTPDGAVKPSKGFSSVQFSMFFPSLPSDANSAAGGWTRSGDFGSVMTYKPETTQPPNEFIFNCATDGPENQIYLSTNQSTFHFDCERGLISRSESEFTQGYGFKGKGSGTCKLKSVEQKDHAFVAQLDREITIFDDANERYRTLNEAGEKDSAKLDEALDVLKRSSAEIQTPMLKDVLNLKITQHNEYLTYARESASRKAKLVNQPAPDWSLEDVDGTKHSLGDFKGKVVVLDFWYRGCGWCIRAMPQIKELADDFKDQPVAILGMNTDQNVDDAKFVIQKMALNYPTLRTTHDFAGQYGVQGFPTLVIIDQQGKIVDFHVGYSPDLREKVGKQIAGLLKSKPN